MASGEFTIAMVTLKSDRNDAMGLLRQWASGSKEGEFFYSHAYDCLLYTSDVYKRQIILFQKKQVAKGAFL